MGSRKVPFENGEYYHIYNRGADKRRVFMDEQDIQRFFRCMQVFNSCSSVGSLWEFDVAKLNCDDQEKLVSIIVYCLNPNHYHLVLRQEVDGGVSEFMKRLSGGYTMYFNNRHERSGVLFQGRFKSKHIDSNEYLLHLSVYVNLNYEVHKFGGSTSKLTKSSWDEYINGVKGICDNDIVMGQFSNDTKKYEKFAREALQSIIKRKRDLKDIEFGG